MRDRNSAAPSPRTIRPERWRTVTSPMRRSVIVVGIGISVKRRLRAAGQSPAELYLRATLFSVHFAGVPAIQQTFWQENPSQVKLEGSAHVHPQEAGFQKHPTAAAGPYLRGVRHARRRAQRLVQHPANEARNGRTRAG